MNASTTLAEAAEILTTQAEELRIGSTYLGDWQYEYDAKVDHSRMVRVAHELQKIDIGVPIVLIPYIAAAGILTGYVIKGWLG